ncbi:hypothetical protein CGCF415_v007504 [Colletotrichum fructicola]|uniref:Uncharacterized protein n=1 Tax=Colletotrichum fructicola (strain Nara gc5) TaxID=1213859 RepID=L2FDN3_COLFN|nr:hypothetical protein CFRS1_v006502 [Colletotrichum fructicola]KAF4484789.1 hypothetical protein CGGC5_v007183 [Colletotrichum fructicola Nara gc5]KAF4883826.1 hypothetical protein CGCFRS4_v013263 [Colletotrichum fructicola]KAF4907126.1 hypothetical protein CGCF415_v007504 [Colletotrichum fructicola]KAF4936668.1 hypothetical protein CGCF245_v006298 [Colletotrichum fructicola]
MKYFALLIGSLTLLTPSLSLATHCLPRSPVPEPAPGILDNINDFFGDLVDDISDAGKKVWSKLDDGQKKILDGNKSLTADGCKMVPCGVELGVTSATCLVAVLGRKGAGKTADHLGCLASVVETEQDLKSKEVCGHCWSAITGLMDMDRKV